MPDQTVKYNLMDNSGSEPAVVPKKKERKANWRLAILATPRVTTPKYQEPPYALDTGVSEEALKAEPRERDIQMAIPPLRLLYVNKRAYAGHPNTHKRYEQVMDKHIEQAWNSIYNEYKKARRDKRLRIMAKQSKLKRGKGKKRKKSKGRKGEKGKKGKQEKKPDKGSKTKKDDDLESITSEDLEKQFKEWVDKRSKPKPAFEPEPISRGPNIDLETIKARLEIIAIPTHPREKYVAQPPPKHIVKESALTYEATERILEIAKPPAFRLIKEEPIVLGAVKRGALLYKASERIAQIATPRARASKNDADLKEDPFSIPPNALKYKATPRIVELAKPSERR